MIITLKPTKNTMIAGGAVMLAGAAAAITAGAVKKKNEPAHKFKKFVKKSSGAIDGIMNNIGYMFG